MINPKKLIMYDSIDEEELIEVYDKKLQCESCDKVGSYFLEREQSTDPQFKIGACRRCLNSIDNYKNIREYKGIHSGKYAKPIPDQVAEVQIHESQWVRARDYQ